MAEEGGLITLQEIVDVRAALRSSKEVHRTPLLPNIERLVPQLLSSPSSSSSSSSSSPSSSSRSLMSVHCKLECLQTHGSFKTRGTAAVLAQLTAAERQRGLVTMSAGNFGRSFAAGCAQQQVDGVVCMPDDVPADRVGALQALGATVVLAPRQQLMAAVAQQQQSHHRLFVHPFDDRRLFRAYGSIGLEILEDFAAMGKTVDVVVVGVGGGGLIAGIASALRLSGSFHGLIYGVEPVGAASMHRSLRNGQPATLDKIETFVNGLAPPFAGAEAYKHVKAFVDGVVLVEDDQVREAMRVYAEQVKLLVEPAGAASLAAVLFGLLPVSLQGKSVVVITSGGNVSLTQLNQEISRLPVARL